MALQRLRQDHGYEPMGLVTTVTDAYDRISIHGVRREILHAQVAELDLPLHEVVIPPRASNALYEAAFGEALARIRVQKPHLRSIAFGDLFLEEIRSYRQRLLARLGWEPVFPLWGQDTAVLARQLVADGFKAVVCCVDTTQLAPDWAGKMFDTTLLENLPPAVDPCGERGEFHTCVFAGPIFRRPLALDIGDRVRREERFEYCELRLHTALRP